MDFLDPNKKKARARRLLLTYIFLASVIAGGTLVLGLRSYGYHLNRQTGEITQSGLLFVSARPQSAEIYLNGELRQERTDTRLDLPAGDYRVELKRDAYRPWQRDIKLPGGSIERLVYPVLFPTDLVTADVSLYATLPGFSSQSPDRRWLLVLRPGSLTNPPTVFDVFDLNNDNTPATAITLPETLLTPSDQPQKLLLVEWSTDNRHVLIEHTFGTPDGEQHEFIMLDREAPASSFNINKTFNINNSNLSQVALRNKRFDRLYFYDAAAKTLRTADVRAKTVAPLLDRVLAFKPHDDNRLLYVTDRAAAPGTVNAKILDGGIKGYTIKRLPVAERYLLDMARFDSKWYVAAGSASDSKIYVYENPLEEITRRPFRPLEPVTTLEAKGASQLSFSANARFIALQGGQDFAIYDFETNRRHAYTIAASLADGHEATWMDGHRLGVVSENNTVIFDYDGLNPQTLAPATAFQPYFNRDYTALYTIAPSPAVPTRPALLRTELKVE